MRLIKIICDDCHTSIGLPVPTSTDIPEDVIARFIAEMEWEQDDGCDYCIDCADKRGL